MPNPAKLVDAAGDAIRSLLTKGQKPIRAFHASPRNFPAFDFKHIGTGEGSQAFGHGGYFASNPKVMQYYYDNFRVAAPGKRADFHPDLIEYAEQTLARKGSVEEAVAELMADYRYISQESSYEAQKYMDMADYLRGLSPQKPTRYEVDLNIPESALLDWDVPLAHQSEYVKSAMAPFGNGRFGLVRGGGADAETGAAAYQRISAALHDGRSDDLSKGGWQSFTQTTNDSLQDQAAASNALRNAGIPGIRYLDEFSRGDGYGTRNYVMFPGTEDQIRILRKYGLIPPTVGAALSQQQQEGSTAPGVSAPRQ